MSKAGQKSGGGGRAISDDEAELWRQLTRGLDPLKAKPRIGSVATGDGDPANAAEKRAAAPAKAESQPRSAATPPAPAIPKPARKPPPLADFNRRKVRQIASGKVEVDARIDLHGSRQRDAHARLRAFLLAAHAEGHRTVLVITGKGGEAEPADGLGSLMGERQRGVLRRSVPHWLEEPDLRAIVLSYTQAGIRHGGAGALYVQLRKGGRARDGD
jgi:DNA-nicking Smr family endonuclease